MTRKKKTEFKSHTIKVDELEGALLDYWVAQTMGIEARIMDGVCELVYRDSNEAIKATVPFSPSKNKNEADPLIISGEVYISHFFGPNYLASMPPTEKVDFYRGQTYTVAAMRCIVGGAFGDHVENVT